MATQQQWKEESLNFDEIPDALVPPQPSIYEGLIVSATRSPTKEGRPQISLDIDLETNMVKNEAGDGQIRYSRVLVVGGKAGFRLKQLVNSTGVEAPEGTSIEAVDAFCERLAGSRVWLRSKLDPSFKDPSVLYPGVAAFLTQEEAINQANALQATEAAE